MNELFLSFSNSKFSKIIKENLLYFYSSILIIVFSILYYPIQFPVNIGFLADITVSMNLYQNQLSFLVFNDTQFALKSVLEAPGYIWIQSFNQYIFKSTSFTMVLFWIPFTLFSLYYLLKILPEIDLLLSKSHTNLVIETFLVSLLIIPFIFKFYLFEIFLVFIFINTPFLYYFFIGSKRFFTSDYRGKKDIFKSFFFVFVYFFIFGQKTLFVVFIALCYFILYYHKISETNSQFPRKKVVYELFAIELTEFSFLLGLFMILYSQNIIFFIFSSFAVFFGGLYLSDTLIISDTNQQDQSTNENTQELKKLFRQFHIINLLIVLSLIGLQIWFSLLLRLPASPLNYQISLNALSEFYLTLFN